jgi:hypothetical protein
MTRSEAPVSATIAIQSVAWPVIASAKKTALTASESAMFALIVRSVARPSRMA